MSREYQPHLQIRQLETGDYLAISDDLPGLVAQGSTLVEAAEISRDVARKLIESYRSMATRCPRACALRHRTDNRPIYEGTAHG